MANKDFDSIEALFSYIEDDISKVLRNEVLDTVKEEMVEATETAVYSQYDPTQYIRRRGNDGLEDIRNIDYEDVSKTEIDVRNYARTNPAYGGGNEFLDEFIVYGDRYTWTHSRIYQMQPFRRDFYFETMQRLQSNMKYLQTFKNAMKKKGYDIV